LLLRQGDIRTGEIDLVDDRDNLHALLYRQVGIRHGLCFDALCGINKEKRSLAGSKAARNFVGEINVPGRIDKIKGVFRPVAMSVFQSHRVTLDGNSALTLQIH
jgi:hypothetical protein